MAQDIENAAVSTAAPPGSRPPAGQVGRLAPGVSLGGRYEVGSFITRGLLAELYDGVDTETDHPITVHLLHAALAQSAPVATSVSARARAVTGLDHKNLAQTLHVGTCEAGPFVVTELIDGHTVRELLERRQKTGGKGFGARGTANITGGVLAALEAAHGTVAHGAIGPDTVYVNKAGRVKLVDLGLGGAVPAAVKARLVPAPGSLAPEDATGGAASPAGDVYAVGRLIYELLVGRPLVKGGPRPSDIEPVDPSVDELVARCSAPKPADRPTAAALRAELAAALKKKVAPRASAPMPAASAPSINLPAFGDADEAPAPPRPSGVQAVVGFDSTEEKWLVSKGKLDYGPFSLAAVVKEIRGDQVLPGHVVVDNDTGARCKVQDHPLLGAEVEKAKQRRDDARRAQAEEHVTIKETRRSYALFVFIGLGAVALGLGVYFLVLGKQTDPLRPTVIAEGRGGSAAWEYAVVVLKDDGVERVVSEKRAIDNGSPKLDEESFNRISWPKVSGARGYLVYRTRAGGVPDSTGVIGSLDAETLELVDSGLDGDGSNLAEALGSLEEGKLLAKITFPDPPKRPAASKRKSSRRSTGGGDSSSPGGFDFGSEGGEEVLDQGQINPVIQRSSRSLARCLLSKGASQADIEFVIARTGRVNKVVVTGANPAATTCITG
ncbi:MAG TPA: protein kinase, partial [Kofleriaceae bacterium]|nr:protein kinase [Kofleriaceae bacterium]